MRKQGEEQCLKYHSFGANPGIEFHTYLSEKSRKTVSSVYQGVEGLLD